MAKEKTDQNAAPTIAVKLFELPPEERKFIEANALNNAETFQNLAEAEAQAQAERKALFDALIAKYPPSVGNMGMRLWKHADLGEVAYIEVAINGGYFDPRTANANYRPDLDVPVFHQQTGAVFLKS